MNHSEIISKINSFLHEASVSLVAWLEGILPRVGSTWWEDCVISSLNYTQREIAKAQSFDRLADFDLAALLRITNKSWYDMRTVEYLPTSERECVREMMAVRNNWAHCSAELPGKDIIITDLKTILSFIKQVNGRTEILDDISNFISHIERPDSIQRVSHTASQPQTELNASPLPSFNTSISQGSIVYLVGSPETHGVVLNTTDLNGITKYNVFVNNSIQSYYTGQVALVEETSGYKWLDIDTFRSYLTAYQINNPSSQNLYSLNSARIDFVPYQFRPALKLIHSDEPRILIADSVGVGKTIEAGLIIKELQARTDLEKVLIICPRPLVAERKWEMEMKRFDEEFIPLDGPTLRQAISDTDRDGEWPARYNKAIIPYSIFDSRVYNGETKGRHKAFGLSELDPAPHFDLVIIDEAHHIRNGSMDKEKAFAYKCTKFFCDHADAVVMLTATPLQTSDNDLFTLLNVLRPDVVIDQKTFSLMSKPNEFVSKAVRIMRSAEPNWAQSASEVLWEIKKTQWGENVISENPLFDDILLRLEAPSITRESRVKLISDTESLHSFNTMLNRTRRRDIQDFCVRRSHTISVEFTDSQKELHNALLDFERNALSMLHDTRSVPFMMSTIKRQAASCIFGLTPHIRAIIDRRFQQINDDPEFEYPLFDEDGRSAELLSTLARAILHLADNLPEEDPKFEKTLSFIMEKQQMENNKIMLFSTFRHTLAYLKQKLVEQGLRVEQVDGSVKDEQRYSLKERFSLPKTDPNALDILLFTEVGSEGLDYQFCDMMINYDLPWNPMRIEQRIGRIDRRGQKSEAVNIYNVITEETVDADIYYRCLARIGVFEKSIGECEEILGEIATEIGSIVTNATLTESERKIKLEQMADNEVRKIQELNKLEEEEKELFGFDLSEFTTAQEIRKAENPWLTPSGLQRLIEQYFKKRLETGTSISGEGSLKNLRLSALARAELRDDSRKLPGPRTALKRSWEGYLSGRNPNHAITFDSDTAEKHRDSFFITAMHPLAKQAAAYFSYNETAYLKLEHHTSLIPEGCYPFSIYTWKYLGINPHSKLVIVCDNQEIETELTDILDSAFSSQSDINECELDWSSLETKQVRLWQSAKTKHKADTDSAINFKLEILSNNRRNRVRSLEQQINDAIDDSIRRMRMSELEIVEENYNRKVAEVTEAASRADIHTKLLANGIIIIRRG